MEYKFYITPSMIDKLKGNVLEVKKSELDRLAETFKKIVKENEDLTKKCEDLEKENRNLKKESNDKILSNEIGYGKLAAKIENENNILKSKIDSLQKVITTMEKLYLDEIKDLKMKLKSNNLGNIKAEIRNEIEVGIKESIKKLSEESIEVGENFDIEI